MARLRASRPTASGRRPARTDSSWAISSASAVAWLSSALCWASCSWVRRPVMRLSASALTILSRSATTPSANPFAMSRARSGESAVAWIATMLLWATGSAVTCLSRSSGLSLSPSLSITRLGDVAARDHAAGGLDVARRVARLADDRQPVQRVLVAAGGNHQQVCLGAVLVGRDREVGGSHEGGHEHDQPDQARALAKDPEVPLEPDGLALRPPPAAARGVADRL